MIFECLKIVLSRIKTLIMKLNQDRTLNHINSFRLDEKYTDTVFKFSDGHIYVHWMILEAHGSIWWTLARDTNCDNIVEVILPEISLAEGLVFVEEVYSSINSLKALIKIETSQIRIQFCCRTLITTTVMMTLKMILIWS